MKSLSKLFFLNQKDLIKSQKRHQATYFNAPRLQVESLTESASNWFQSCLSDRFLIYFLVLFSVKKEDSEQDNACDLYILLCN